MQQKRQKDSESLIDQAHCQRDKKLIQCGKPVIDSNAPDLKVDLKSLPLKKQVFKIDLINVAIMSFAGH